MKNKLSSSKIEIRGKFMINEYSESPKCIEISLEGNKSGKSGIYEIRNKFNGKRYIGKARNLFSRIGTHKWNLLRGTHKSKEMQKDFFSNCRPLDITLPSELDEVFEFNVILYCHPSELDFFERLIINYIKPEYNTQLKKTVKPDKLFDENGEIIIEELEKDLLIESDLLDEENFPFSYIGGDNNKALEELAKKVNSDLDDDDFCEEETM